MKTENVKTDPDKSNPSYNFAPPSLESQNLNLEYRLALVGPDGPVMSMSGSAGIPMALDPRFNNTAHNSCVTVLEKVIAPSFKNAATFFFHDRRMEYYAQKKSERADGKSAPVDEFAEEPQPVPAPKPDILELLAKEPNYAKPPIPTPEDDGKTETTTPPSKEPGLATPQTKPSTPSRAAGQTRRAA